MPGVAVLLEFLQEFRLPAVYYSRAGVRDGIIADLAARNVGAELSRLTANSAAKWRKWAGVTACRWSTPARWRTFPACCSPRSSRCTSCRRPCGKLLEAAAYLHDVGHFVSSVGHHKHSYYVVSNSDMPGFTDARARPDRRALPLSPQVACPRRCTAHYQSLTPEEKRMLTAV